MPRTILLVEDDAEAARAFLRLLRLDGHDVVIAGSFAEAAQCCQSRAFDLLITDIELPDGDGLRLFERARARGCPHAIVVSGHDDPERRDRAAQAGFEHYFVKPVSWPELRAHIQ